MSEWSKYSDYRVDAHKHGYTSSARYLLYYVYIYTLSPDLRANISITVNGSDAVVCVETESAAAFKLILRDARDERYIRDRERSHISQSVV